MQLFLKAATVFFLTLFILIPLALIQDVVRDRQAYRAQAVRDIAANVGTAQTFAGPVLVVPYMETKRLVESDSAGRNTTRDVQTQKVLYVFPQRLSLGGPLQIGVRARGMHKVRVFEWVGRVDAHFEIRLAANADGVTREFSRPWLSFEFSDPRGLQGVPVLSVNGTETRVLPGSGFRSGNGVHARMAAPVAGDSLMFDVKLNIGLKGTQSLSIVPLADDNRIDLRSDWRAPKFVGASPEQTPVARGFDAHWRVSALSVNVQNDFVSGKTLSQRPMLPENATTETAWPGRISVAFIDPVNAYSSTARAVKYGVLFIAVTFAGFFLFEFLKRAPIHPIQYLLVGFAIAIFFLLLLSLGEHVAFGAAYAVAAAGCLGLITWYLASVLRGWKPAIGFTALLATLYGVLYGLLISEDNALIMGSALLFVLLAAIMVLTRNVDWYALSPPAKGLKGLIGGQTGARE